MKVFGVIYNLWIAVLMFRWSMMNHVVWYEKLPSHPARLHHTVLAVSSRKQNVCSVHISVSITHNVLLDYYTHLIITRSCLCWQNHAVRFFTTCDFYYLHPNTLRICQTRRGQSDVITRALSKESASICHKIDSHSLSISPRFKVNSFRFFIYDFNISFNIFKRQDNSLD